MTLTAVLALKPKLYSNSQPNRPKPNSLWTKTLSLYTKTSIPLETIKNLTFKSLYQTLLKLEPNPTPFTNTPIPHTWLRLTLTKPRPSLFSNLEKEISYRTAYKGYTWDVSFQNTTLNLVTQMISFVKSVFLLPMTLIISFFTVLSLEN